MLQANKYANVLAKIGVKRSNLLDATKFKKLTQTKNLSDFASNLKETIYQERIAKIFGQNLPSSSRELERIFRESLIEDYVNVIKNSPKTASIFLKIYIQRFEVENLKALVKSIHAQLGFQEKKDRLYFQVEDFLRRRSIFEEASKSSDIKQLAEIMKKTDYASALKQGLLSYEENGTTACIDILLDKIFCEEVHNSFVHLSKGERFHAAFYKSAEEASYVLLTLLRGKNLNYDADWLRTIIPEKNLSVSKKMIEALVIAPNFESALGIILKSPFSIYFKKAQTPEETIATGEKAFQKALYIHATKKAVIEVFNIGLPLAFMIQKEVEVHNLSSTCLGIEVGMNSEEILSNLLFSS